MVAIVAAANGAKGTGKSPAFSFYSGDWISSPDVMLMTAAERGAYIQLLAVSWESTPRPYIENNEERIRRIADLTPKQWSESRALLLKKFPATEDGTLRYNPRLRLIAEQQAAYREQMKKNGDKGGRPRADNQMVCPENQKVILDKPEGNLNQTFSSLSLSSTSKEQVQELFPSSDEKGKKLSAKKIPDPRHTPFKEAFERYFVEHNPGATQAPWSGQEATQLGNFLTENPTFTLEQWERVLLHRSRSPTATPSKKLSQWIAHAWSFHAGPANDFGNALQSKGDKPNYAQQPSRNANIVTTGRDAFELLAAEELASRSFFKHGVSVPVAGARPRLESSVD